MTDAERARHAAALRGLLYLACPDAPATAITETAAAIARRAETRPEGPAPEAATLKHRSPRGSRTPKNLNGADLTGADLTGAKLARADLTDAALIRANLTGADLIRANLIRANLTHANLTHANLMHANLTGANLTGARNMLLPPGAIWNRETRWPAELVSAVFEQSDEVSPGLYRVRGGPAPDRSDTSVLV
uniref:pentapeptide repeat-containing protein n=1 Tax=Streptomyces sp. NBC_01562 TaxID=2975879 RepID=UPI002F919167